MCGRHEHMPAHSIRMQKGDRPEAAAIRNVWVRRRWLVDLLLQKHTGAGFKGLGVP